MARQTGSSPTSRRPALAGPKTVGSLVGGLGSPKTEATGLVLAGPSGPPPALPDPSNWLSAIVDPQTRHWLALLRYHTIVPTGTDVEQARRDLAPALFRARRALAPSTPEEITRALRILAETLQQAMPEPDGVMAYVAVLQSTPYQALRLGFVEILKSYAYPRWPYPAELLAACAASEAEIRFWCQSIERACALLEKADAARSSHAADVQGVAPGQGPGR